MSERQNQKWGYKKEKRKVFKSQVKLYLRERDFKK